MFYLQSHLDCDNLVVDLNKLVNHEAWEFQILLDYMQLHAIQNERACTQFFEWILIAHHQKW